MPTSRSRKNKTIKIKSHDIKQKIIIKFLEILNMIKLYLDLVLIIMLYQNFP